MNNSDQPMLVLAGLDERETHQWSTAQVQLSLGMQRHQFARGDGGIRCSRQIIEGQLHFARLMDDLHRSVAAGLKCRAKHCVPVGEMVHATPQNVDIESAEDAVMSELRIAREAFVGLREPPYSLLGEGQRKLLSARHGANPELVRFVFAQTI